MKSFYATGWDNWCLINSGARDSKPQHPLRGTTLPWVNKELLWESGRGTRGGHGEVLPCRKRCWWEGVRQTLTFTCLPFLPAANWDKFVLRAGLYLSRARYKERGVNYHPSPTLSCSFFLPPPGPLPCLPATSHHAISLTTVSSCYHPLLAEAHTY